METDRKKRQKQLRNIGKAVVTKKVSRIIQLYNL